MKQISYKSGYKYQLSVNYCDQIPIKPEIYIDTGFIKLSKSGSLVIKSGYAWDGPSGPTFDTKTFMRASLVHDALYQIMRMGLLDINGIREQADSLLRTMCLQDKMNPIRAWWVYQAVRLGAGFAADPGSRRPIVQAP